MASPLKSALAKGQDVSGKFIEVAPSGNSVAGVAPVGRLVPAKDAYRYGFNPLNPEQALPARALAAEKTDSPAAISIVLGPGAKDYRKPVTNDSGVTQSQNNDLVSAYSRFFLQAVSEGQSEKYQIVETFTAHYTFFYGKKPALYNFRGVLLNDEYHRWASDFSYFYENYFRGTKTVERGAYTVITYDEKQVHGFIVDFALQQQSDLDKGVSFSMNLLVTHHEPLAQSRDIQELLTAASQELLEFRNRREVEQSRTSANVPPEVGAHVAGVANGTTPAAKLHNVAGTGPEDPRTNSQVEADGIRKFNQGKQGT